MYIYIYTWPPVCFFPPFLLFPGDPPKTICWYGHVLFCHKAYHHGIPGHIHTYSYYICVYVPGFLGPPPTPPPQWSCSVKKVAQCDPTSPPPPCGMGGGGSMLPTPAPLWEWGLGRMVAQCDRKAPRDYGSHTARWGL